MVAGKKVPEPKMGLDEEFDKMNERIDEIKQELQDYLQEVRKDTGCE